MQANKEIPLPDFEELLGVVDVARPAAPTEADIARQFAATLVAALSVLMGLIGNLVFYANPVGINVVMYTALGLLVAFGILIVLRRHIVLKHASFALLTVIFAFLLSVRLAPQLIMFNVAALLGSLIIVTHFTGTTRFIGGHWFKPVQYALETAVVGWIESLRVVVPDSLRGLARSELDNQKLANLGSVLRGVLITLPIVAVFTLLLSSADAVFGDLTERAVNFFLPESIDSVIQQFLLVMVFTVLSLTVFWTMLQTRASSADDAMTPGKTRWFRLNMIETSTVLGSVNLLFLTFVMIQARYFFGGEANITAQGYTYAEYARRGFYELLAASCMTMVLLVALENFTYRKREEEIVFRSLVALMIGLTFVILIAAFRRLNLYEDAYGFTRIRVMSGTFMIWLAALLCGLLIAILSHKREIFWLGCIVTSLGFILTLNVMNMDGFIAGHNIARFEETGKLDVPYLLSLSDDAIPTIAVLLDNPNLEANERRQLQRGLGTRLNELDRDREEWGVFGYHLGKNRAWQSLDHYRAVLASSER